jgi:hypothetical protein
VTEHAWIHLTARMSTGFPDLTREDTGAWLWRHLRRAFPKAIAVTLMPDHPHVVLASVEPVADRQRLARLLGQLGRRLGVQGRASQVPDAQVIRPGNVLARQVHYVALNPCRKRLASCPLEWMWSTHRDLVGASVDPWVPPPRLAEALELPACGFARRHHAYVSGDPSASITGTPFPLPAPPSQLGEVALRSIAEACTMALRTPLGSIRRPGVARALFVALAREQGWTHVERLAQVCDCSRHTIARHASEVDVVALGAARLCLGDQRLRARPHGRVAS